MKIIFCKSVYLKSVKVKGDSLVCKVAAGDCTIVSKFTHPLPPTEKLRINAKYNVNLINEDCRNGDIRYTVVKLSTKGDRAKITFMPSSDHIVELYIPKSVAEVFCFGATYYGHLDFFN